MSLEIDELEDSWGSGPFYFQLAGIDPENPLWNGHRATLADAPAIQEAIESLITTAFLTQDPNTSGYLMAAAYFARLGGQDSPLIAKEIVELLNSPEGLLARGQDGVIIPAKFFSKTWRWCQKHSTAILIGVAVVAAIATTIILAAGAATAAGALLNDDKKSAHRRKAPRSDPSDPLPVATAPSTPTIPLSVHSRSEHPCTNSLIESFSVSALLQAPTSLSSIPTSPLAPFIGATSNELTSSTLPLQTPISLPPSTPCPSIISFVPPSFQTITSSFVLAPPSNDIPNPVEPSALSSFLQTLADPPSKPPSIYAPPNPETSKPSPMKTPSLLSRFFPPKRLSSEERAYRPFINRRTGLPVIDRSKVWKVEPGSPPFEEIPLIGDKDRHMLHFHCGINNDQFTVKDGGACLHSILDRTFAIQPHRVHSSSLLVGLAQVGLENLNNTYRSFIEAGFSSGGVTQGLAKIPGAILDSSLGRSIDYTVATLTRIANEIIAQDKPNLKQLHVTFSNGGYVFKEALLKLNPEQRNTVIVITTGTTAIIDASLACQVYNVIGDKDWPSQVCNGGRDGIERARGKADVEIISQEEVDFVLGGHYFKQSDYQEKIKSIYQRKIVRSI